MKAMKLEVPKMCDRDQSTIVSNQTGFVEYCLKPLAESMAVLIQELDECLENIPLNIKMLSQVQEESEVHVSEGETANSGLSKM